MQSIKEDAAPFYPTQPLEGNPSTRITSREIQLQRRDTLRVPFSPHSSIERSRQQQREELRKPDHCVSLKLFFNRLPTTTDLHPKPFLTGGDAFIWL